MPKPRNLRNDVLPQLLQRHVVGDQRRIRIAGELHRRQPRVPIRRNHRRYRDGAIEVRIGLLFIDRRDDRADEEPLHGTFHDGEAIQSI